MKMIVVPQKDGSVYHVPAHIVAASRATYYAEQDEDTTYDEEFKYTMGSDSELLDWAQNNMRWTDVAEQAVQAKPPSNGLSADELEDAWMGNQGNVEVIEIPGLTCTPWG